GAEKYIQPASIGRVSVKDRAALLDEGAQARRFLAGEFPLGVIVLDLARHLVLGEGDVEIVIEVAAVRRHPFEFPAHPLLVGLDFGQRRATRSPATRHVGPGGYWRHRNDRPDKNSLGSPPASPGRA